MSRERQCDWCKKPVSHEFKLLFERWKLKGSERIGFRRYDICDYCLATTVGKEKFKEFMRTES